MAMEIVDFTIKNCHLYRTYPLEMEVLYGFMGKSWEYMGIPGLVICSSLLLNMVIFYSYICMFTARLTIKDDGDIFVDIT